MQPRDTDTNGSGVTGSQRCGTTPTPTSPSTQVPRCSTDVEETKADVRTAERAEERGAGNGFMAKMAPDHHVILKMGNVSLDIVT